MQYIQIPNIANPVSRIGFGTWGLSGDSYGSISESQAINAIEFAFDSGVTFLIQQIFMAMAELKAYWERLLKDSSKVILSSKVGYIQYPQKEQDFSPFIYS